MAVKIVTDKEPKVDAFLLPVGVRTLDFRDVSWAGNVTIPESETVMPRTATRIKLSGEEIFFVIDKEVKTEKKWVTQRVDQMLAISMDRYEEWLSERAEREGVPDVAEMAAEFLHSMQCYEYTWTWWEVTL